MGYFRRYKLSDFSADECRAKLKRVREQLRRDIHLDVGATELLEEWACLRELLARHEKNNQSPLDN